MGLCFATDHADQYLVQNSAEFRVLKSALEFLNLDSNKFTSNSVRIKAATKAHLQDFSDSQIRVMGRCHSE